VSYNDGKLTVDATNASLNEILREVSSKTGMKVTGTVDDRVFGHYGPASPAMVLDALLEGTGSNVLLVDGSKGTANGAGTLGDSELVLTPRHGGAPSTSPNAPPQNGDAEEGAGQYVPPARPYLPPVPNGRSVATVPSADGTPGSGADGADGGGPKTPQQIYDQLQRVMQQQKQAPAQTPPQQ
jgi:hypothetical protein